MTEAELHQIIERAMARLAELGLQYRFNSMSSQILTELASGFPWFVHLLGREALLTAYTAKRDMVFSDDVDWAVRSLADNRFAQQFRDLYHMLVGESVNREMVVRTFALWPSQDIPTRPIYQVLRRLGITSPSPYVRQLFSERYGQIFMRPPLKERGIVRFINEMFKVYVRVRRPLFDVDDSIRQAWRAEFDGTEHAYEAEPVLPT
jgi:histone H3/H4